MTLIPTPHRPLVRQVFFWSGILATIAYRAVIFFNGRSKLWVSGLWYFGTVGFILYFAHRYQISRRRAAVIHEQQLEMKVQRSDLTPDDKAALAYLFTTLESSKERWNYYVIFVSSGVALLVSLYLDFFHR